MSNLAIIGLVVVAIIPLVVVALDLWNLKRHRRFLCMGKEYLLSRENAGVFLLWLTYRLGLMVFVMFLLHQIGHAAMHG
jgi:hypothetical protein